jgi:hypothetical protein
MTQSFVYNTTPGQPYLYDSTIAYSNLLFCARDGIEYDVIYSNDTSIVLGTRQVQYSESFGFLRFAIDFNVGERVQIIIGEI